MPGYRVNHQCDIVDREQPMRRRTNCNDIIENPIEKAIPMDGEMTFDGNVTDILDSPRFFLAEAL